MKKKILRGLIFCIIMVLTFYAVLHGQNLKEIGQAMGQMAPLSLLLAVLAALFFVCAEGTMIWYLLRAMHGKSGLLQCIGYSFVGFFYSGITPSATGGQPAQLYYMKKDGNSLADSSVVLMTVALLYKLVLVILGCVLLLCFGKGLQERLSGYYGLYLFGLSLNVILVALLLAVMGMPLRMKRLILGLEERLVRRRLLKASDQRRERIERFIGGYQEAVAFLWKHKGKVIAVLAATFLQRSSMFLLTGLIYCGFSLKGTDFLTVTLLQAAVYIAVDMLPVPGAQGITELMYCHVFSSVFPGHFLMASLYVNRGISFYFLLLVSLAVTVIRWLGENRRHEGPETNLPEDV